LIFVTLAKFRSKPTKEMAARNLKITEEGVKRGIKTLNVYWTMGRYDVVAISEAPDEKTLLNYLLKRDWVSTETLLAIPLEEAQKLVEA
jgi:uncharacterized protein with GYD domain